MAQTARKYQTYPTPLEQSPKQPRQPKQLVARKQRVHYSLFEVFFCDWNFSNGTHNVFNHYSKFDCIA